jgi:hypothetical protein
VNITPNAAGPAALAPEAMEGTARPGILLAIVGLGLLTVLLLVANTGFTLLKENPWFWRNAGGYSIELRQAVLSFYYPLLGLNFLLCLIYSGLAAAHQPLFGRISLWAIGVALLLWSMLFLNIGLLTANNLQNVLNGRPVHYHPVLSGSGSR